MPVDEHGQKWSCLSCQTGHRSSKCRHFDRWMLKVKTPGRPLRACPHEGACGCQDGNMYVMMAIGKGTSVTCNLLWAADGLTSYPETAANTCHCTRNTEAGSRPIPQNMLNKLHKVSSKKKADPGAGTESDRTAVPGQCHGYDVPTIPPAGTLDGTAAVMSSLVQGTQDVNIFPASSKDPPFQRHNIPNTMPADRFSDGSHGWLSETRQPGRAFSSVGIDGFSDGTQDWASARLQPDVKETATLMETSEGPHGACQVGHQNPVAAFSTSKPNRPSLSTQHYPSLNLLPTIQYSSIDDSSATGFQSNALAQPEMASDRLFNNATPFQYGMSPSMAAKGYMHQDLVPQSLVQKQSGSQQIMSSPVCSLAMTESASNFLLSITL